MSDFNLANEDELFPVNDDSETNDSTVLNSVREELKRVIKNEPITRVVPNRPNMALVFDTNISADSLAQWRKVCVNKALPDDFDGLKFSCIVIANTCLHMYYDGKIATDTAGNDLSFRNQSLLKMLGVERAVPGVRQLYGNDGHIFTVAAAILSAAGYDDDGQEQSADPTLLV